MTPPTRTRTSRVYPRECGEAPGHCQVDDEQASSAAIDALVQFSELGTGRVSPDPDCLAPHQAMVHGAEQVAADAKQIQDAVRRGVTAELVRDQTARGAALALQQRPEESCGSVPMGSGRPGSLLTLAPHIERHEIVCPRIDAFYTEHLYCGEDDLFGSGHSPDTVVAMALAYHAFKAGRQPGDYGVTI